MDQCQLPETWPPVDGSYLPGALGPKAIGEGYGSRQRGAVAGGMRRSGDEREFLARISPVHLHVFMRCIDHGFACYAGMSQATHRRFGERKRD
jgi:hypothetical protein